MENIKDVNDIIQDRNSNTSEYVGDLMSNNENLSKETLVEVSNLTKVYKLKSKSSAAKGTGKSDSKNKEIRAVDDVSFTVQQGEIFGLLGSNGAGKTTIIKMLCGLITPTSGSIKIFGKEIIGKPETVLGQIGAIVEAPSLFKDMTGLENLRYLSILQGGLPEQRLLDILELVGLKDRMNSKFATYSLGMQQRLGIAQAIMHNPRLLILDEPINGLDPDGIMQMRELFRNLVRNYGTTIIISSHILTEMQMICDRVGIMVSGKLSAIKSIKEIENQADNSTIAYIACDRVEYAAEILADIENLQIRIVENKLYVKFSGDLIPTINKKLVLADVNVYGITIQKRTLEDIYRELSK